MKSLLCDWLLSCVLSVQGPTPLSDLYYGSVLYDYYQDDYQQALLDTLIVEAGESEGVYLAPFDIDRLRAYRRREVWGNAYRRPRAYSALVSPAVAEPFVRPDATR